MRLVRPDDVERTLSVPTIHEAWEGSYYGVGAEKFYERAFDEITEYLRAGPGETILDAGCGQGYHSIRLARRGFRVEAVDFSPAVLEVARKKIERSGLTSVVHVERDNLLDLSLPDESFSYVLCWGVLMHIPDVEKAIAELSRVLRPGGVAVISEGNRHSLDAIAARLIKRLRSNSTEVVSTPLGLESWIETPAGPLLMRQAKVSRLLREFERHGLELEGRRSGEFTEAYTKVSAAPIAKAIHAFNLFWFDRVKLDRLSAGNILYFRKRGSVAARGAALPDP